MASLETQVLSNSLDALDRLYDGQIFVFDLHALFFATSAALNGSSHSQHFDPVVKQLRGLMRSGKHGDKQRDQALVLTDELRHYLAQCLPQP
jgi:hypothetical protein